MIPVSHPSIESEEIKNALAALKQGTISGSGDFVDQFETMWASKCHRKYGVSVSSGSAALETALFSLNLPKGSHVLMPSFTIISCLGAVLRNHLLPILIDADPDHWCLDTSQLENKITPKTRAIMAVHLFGQPAPMKKIMKFSKKHKLKVIEDASQAHGATHENKICGSFGEVSVFSFYANKILTCGEGGMVLTNSKIVRDKALSYRNLGFGKTNRFLHDCFGQNFRLSNVLAAIACAQIPKLSSFLEKKEWIAHRYLNLLKSIPDLKLPQKNSHSKNVFWMFGLVLGKSHSITAKKLIDRMEVKGIQCRPFFMGLHRQKVTNAYFKCSKKDFPVTDQLSQRGLYLPSGISLNEKNLQFIVKSLKEILTA